MGNNRAAHGAGNGVINDLLHGGLAHAFKVFANTVGHHHRLIHRIAQYGKYGSQYRERELPLKRREKAKNNHHVVEVCHNRGHSKLPFKTNGQVDHDAHNDKQQGNETVGGKFCTHLRAHELHTT